MGYLERNEPLPLDQPDRKATLFVTSHFYLDDFVQSSEDPNPRPLQHTPLHPEDGFRTPAEATDEDVRLARRYQGYGGTRFVEDDLAGDPWPWALRAAQPTASRAARAGCWRTRSSGPSRAARTRPFCLEGVSQMVYILPERLLALVRPAFDLVLRRIRSLKRCVQA